MKKRPQNVIGYLTSRRKVRKGDTIVGRTRIFCTTTPRSGSKEESPDSVSDGVVGFCNRRLPNVNLGEDP